MALEAKLVYNSINGGIPHPQVTSRLWQVTYRRKSTAASDSAGISQLRLWKRGYLPNLLLSTLIYCDTWHNVRLICWQKYGIQVLEWEELWIVSWESRRQQIRPRRLAKDNPKVYSAFDWNRTIQRYLLQMWLPMFFKTFGYAFQDIRMRFSRYSVNVQRHSAKICANLCAQTQCKDYANLLCINPAHCNCIRTLRGFPIAYQCERRNQAGNIGARSLLSLRQHHSTLFPICRLMMIWWSCLTTVRKKLHQTHAVPAFRIRQNFQIVISYLDSCSNPCALIFAASLVRGGAPVLCINTAQILCTNVLCTNTMHRFWANFCAHSAKILHKRFVQIHSAMILHKLLCTQCKHFD